MTTRNEPEIIENTEYGAIFTRHYSVDGTPRSERVYVGPWTHRSASNFVKRTNKNDPDADARIVRRTVRTSITAWE